MTSPRAPRAPRSQIVSRALALIAPPIALVLASMTGVGACHSTWVKGPKVVDQALGPGDGVCVPFPPPPPKVEEIGASPGGDHVWVDGQWAWQTRRWVWLPGGWVVPPPGASYAQWKAARLPNGALAYYKGHWQERSSEKYDANGSMVCPPPPKPEAITAVLGDAADEVEVHVGPVLVYPADAPSSAPPKLLIDATLPSDLGVAEPGKLIGPPD